VSEHLKPQSPELVASMQRHGLKSDTPSQLSDAFRLGWQDALDAAEARAVGVKPLVWELFWKQDDGHREAADTVFGQTYHVSKKGWWRIFEKLRPCDGLDAAKAAAQADYTARILSALHPASPLGAATLAEVNALVKASRPFAAAYFNDNGDVTLDMGHIKTADYRALSAALAPFARKGD